MPLTDSTTDPFSKAGADCIPAIASFATTTFESPVIITFTFAPIMEVSPSISTRGGGKGASVCGNPIWSGVCVPKEGINPGSYRFPHARLFPVSGVRLLPWEEGVA